MSKITIHSCKSLWIGNIYLNKGKIDQIKSLFSKLESLISPYEWGRIILGGDWNTDLRSKTPKRTLLLELAKQMKLKILTANPSTRLGKTLDYFMIGSDLEAKCFSMKTSPSDHFPIKIIVNVPFPRPRIKLLLPNRALAEKLTTENLCISNSSLPFLTNMETSLRIFFHQAIKVVKPLKWENKLLHKILQANENNEIQKIISNYWNDLISIHEITRFSSESNKPSNFSEMFTNTTKIPNVKEAL